jgi:hypothetical protein
MIPTDNTVTSSPAPTANKEVLMTATVQSEIAELVESRIKNGERVTVVNLAAERNISVGELRTALVEAFGNRISFKRGRTGGIVLS